jgi:hypothetical protein
MQALSACPMFAGGMIGRGGPNHCKLASWLTLIMGALGSSIRNRAAICAGV